ncbi:MAG: ADP-ribosylation factor-like protein [Candidatus Hodarchaeota archaeon]
MPPSFSFLKSLLRRKREASICFVGLDKAGKSTIVHRLRTGQFIDNLSRTLGLTIDDLSVGNLSLKTFDLGGQETFRKSIWKPYVEIVTGICFVIDSIDKDRYPLALKELYRTLKITEKRIPLLVLLNKVDLIKEQINKETVMRKKNFAGIPLEEELHQFIGGFLHCLDIDFITHHASNFLVLGTSAKTGEGLKEAFEDFFAVELENYLDLLDSDLGASTTAKDPVKAQIEPIIKDYIPFAHPQLILVVRDGQVILSAKPGQMEVDVSKIEENLLNRKKDLQQSLRGVNISGKLDNLQFLLRSIGDFSIAVFGELDDPFLALKDLVQDVIIFFSQKNVLGQVVSEFEQIEVELEQYLRERYSSIPPSF